MVYRQQTNKKKKKIKKPNLNKRTISNLNTVEMNQKKGGGSGIPRRTIEYTNCHDCDVYPTQKGRTCNGNNC